MEHNAEELQEILNRIVQRIVNIITSALVSVVVEEFHLHSTNTLYKACTDFSWLIELDV